MQATHQDKQTFLRQQIIESGANPDKFIQFMSTFKEQNTDMNLDTWTMQELQQLVHQFKIIKQSRIQDQGQNIEQLPENNKQLVESRINELFSKKVKKVFRYDRDEIWDYEFIKQEKCLKLDRKISAQIKYLKIESKKYQIKKSQGVFFGLFGSKDQLWIQIQTNFTNISVSRKCDDFNWLYDMLQKTFPSVYIPPLQKMTAMSQNQAGIKKRISDILHFMNYTTSYQNVVNTDLFWNFLTINQLTNFDKWKQTYNKKHDFQDLSNLKTIKGVFEAEISKRIDKVIKFSQDLSKYNSQTFGELSANIQKVVKDLQILNTDMVLVRNSFSKLAQNYSRFQEKANTKEHLNLFQTHKFLIDIVDKTMKQTTSQKEVFQELLQKFISKNSQQWKNFSTYRKNFTLQFDNYLKKKAIFRKKKQQNLQSFIAQSNIALDQNKKQSTQGQQQIYSRVFPQQYQKEQRMKIIRAFFNSQYEQSLIIFLRSQENNIFNYYQLYDNYLKKQQEEILNFIQSFTKNCLPSLINI